MASLWPWFAVAGLGALHGLNPATGWMLAAACGLHARDRRQALKALAPIAVGHAASIAIVAGLVSLGLGQDRGPLLALAGALLGVTGFLHRLHRRPRPAESRTGRAALALSAFIMSTLHGAGLMLVPALVPICVGSGPARQITASGSLALALAGVAVHLAAMLAVTGLLATGACRGMDACARLIRHGRGTAPMAEPGSQCPTSRYGLGKASSRRVLPWPSIRSWCTAARIRSAASAGLHKVVSIRTSGFSGDS